MWVVANKTRTKFLAEDDDGQVYVTGQYIVSIAFDDQDEAKDHLNHTFFDEEFSVQIR